MTTLVIRDARREDVPAIIALLAADSLGATGEANDGTVPDAIWAAFDRIGADASNRQIVVERGGEIIGCLQLTFIPGLTYAGGTRMQIEGVRIAEACRRQGIGRALFAWTIAEAGRSGARLVQLTTHKSRSGAEAFYRSLGFSPSHVGMKLDLKAR